MTYLEVYQAVIYGFPSVLHFAGFVLLYQANRVLPNQRLITMNLAVTEMIYCMVQVIYHALIAADLLTDVVDIILEYTLVSYFCAIRFAILHIIIDRFLDIWLNIKYPIYINSRKILISIAIQWTFSSCFGLIHRLIFKFKEIDITLYSDVPLDVLIIVIALLTTLYFFRKLKRIQPNPTSGKNCRQNRSRLWLKLKIPLLMVLTFIIFNASSTILIFFTDGENPNSAEQFQLAYTFLEIFGWTSDALIYILLQKRVRRLLASMCTGGNRTLFCSKI